jgi:hypothetical protein
MADRDQPGESDTNAETNGNEYHFAFLSSSNTKRRFVKRMPSLLKTSKIDPKSEDLGL